MLFKAYEGKDEAQDRVDCCRGDCRLGWFAWEAIGVEVGQFFIDVVEFYIFSYFLYPDVFEAHLKQKINIFHLDVALTPLTLLLLPKTLSY